MFTLDPTVLIDQSLAQTPHRNIKKIFTKYNKKHCREDIQLHQDQTKRPRPTLETLAYCQHETRGRWQTVIPQTEQEIDDGSLHPT